ncbi:DUF2723 domain-containing protein [Solitalea lacus]|uniref:glycosyltransferase family 117 protein n=1 Tax=Solitalea lacus TaxID=2911172 RepID=UPI001EDAB40E|nr:DUF2723 domain-containing protein [Solitalea lacus]UKJ07133.1 DUF2723 domain-containing protein [Solitalea lacus]
MTNYTRLNNLLGWVTFLIATTVYTLTLEPTGSFWDCGEFISSAYRLQVCHQPGAPLFLMISKVLSLFAGDRTQIAWWTNFGSALSSGATIMFLFWSVTHLAKKLLVKNGDSVNGSQTFAIMGAGLVGALAYTFSDTFWFSAVESEVYALSSLCTAIVFWAILKWENEANEKYADRWLVFIAYLMGLSIGVHLLNLLTIPALGLVYYFKKHKATTKGAIITFLISCVILVFVQYGLIPGTIAFAAKFDLFFVNTLGMSFGSGVAVFGAIFIALLVSLLLYSINQSKNLLYASAVLLGIMLIFGWGVLAGILYFIIVGFVLFYWKPAINHYVLNVSVLCTMFIMIGYASFAMIVIRAKANPNLNNNDPSNAYSFLSYLNREQYGDRPLGFGPYYNSEMSGQEKGEMQYRKGATKYEEIGPKPVAQYSKKIPFPRIYSDDPNHVQFYKSWLGITGEPTYADNLGFFIGYQVNYMYFRYFMWNFAGRQNDVQGAGAVHEGNWISGIKPLDAVRLGNQDNLPNSITENKAYNRLYFLPLILGLIGLFFQYKRNLKDFTVVFLLFFMTGLAIVLYLNQTPLQPRERDYAYVGSFYAFAIWIGLGVLAIYEFLGKRINMMASAGVATVLCLVAVPYVMAKEEWDDHDRSNRYTSRDLAANYLNSCEPNAIIFTYGDNDTYPLWYCQEVENIRPDVRIVNLSLLGTDWYGRQMKEKMNESAPVKISLPNEKFAAGIRDYTPLFEQNIQGNSELKEVVDFIASDSQDAKAQTQGGELINYLPTKNFKITVDKNAVLKNKVVDAAEEAKIVPSINWTIASNGLYKNDLLALDIIANNLWERPIYFAITVPDRNFYGLQKYFQNEGFAYRLVPMLSDSTDAILGREGSINTKVLYNNVHNKFKWDNYNDGKIYVDPESSRMTTTCKSTFNILAQALYNEGKVDSCVKTLDKMAASIPFISNQVGYNLIPELMCADLYYKCKAPQKANKQIEVLNGFIINQLDYYHSLGMPRMNRFGEEINLGLSLISELANMASQNKQTAVANKLHAELKTLESKFGAVLQQ